jgi:hypothetical protein
MGQARPARSISAYCLLFALAMQGITPDAQDVASLNALRLLCPNISDSKSLLDDDESPDDVCESVQLDTHLAIRKRIDSRLLPFLGFVSTGHRTPMVPLATPQLPSPFGRNVRIGDLIHVLCRLTC